MARSRETKIELTAYDDLFQTDESREEAKLSKIRDIPISEIDEFPDHPFKVLMDEDMEQLVESIKRNGVTVKVDATTIVQMHNEFRDTPKTGDDFNLGLWVSLAALSVVGAGVLGFVGYKNRKKKKED